MGFAVTHILVPLVILDVLRHYFFGRKKFPRYLIVIAGIAGLAPDLDIPLGWLVSILTGTPASYHGMFTHSFFFVALFLAIGLVRQYQHAKSEALIWYVIAFGWFTHLPIDWVYGWCKNFFWPIAGAFPYCVTWELSTTMGAAIDGVLLTLWLVHEEVSRKVRDWF